MTEREERRKPFAVGEMVTVPAVKGHVSSLVSLGEIRSITPPYATVRLVYGRQTGKWQGLLSDLNRRSRGAPERRGPNAIYKPLLSLN